MTINDLATELAVVASKCGVKAVDHLGLKKLVESLAGQDIRLPVKQRKGWDRIYKTYSASGYTRLFGLVAKNWPKAHDLPPPPPLPPQKPQGTPRHDLVVSYVVSIPGEPELLDARLFCAWVEKKSLERPNKDISLLDMTALDDLYVDFLIQHNCPVVEVYAFLRECLLVGRREVWIRAATEFGSQFSLLADIRSWSHDPKQKEIQQRHAP